MKIRELFICMFFLLLGGGQYFYASTSASSDKPFSKYFQEKHIKQVDTDSFSSFIENTDLDTEEEYSAQKENKDELKFYSSNSSFNSKISFSISVRFIHYNAVKNQISNFLFHSNTPLYISQRVLRI
ncbi:MAG: hypothetical protein RIQ59_2112 [Bacteroidota bacterium]|jgi:hypothetical protein